MPGKNFVRFRRLSLKNHPEFNERWVQERIAEDPSMLGLGDIVLKDKERIQPGAGRLDLLFQDPDSDRRYEVEIQLGKTDESHIIRTIEYWDIERKRYPQYDHTAVLVAEDITSRFLNVISLFNGFIPLIAIQMSALEWEDNVSLMFTTVLDQMTLGPADDDGEPEVTDRAYWERRGTRATIKMADDLLGLIKGLDEGFDFKYNKFYIGLAKDGQSNNFVTFQPQKNALRIAVRLPRSEELERELEDRGLDLGEYKWGRYRIRLTPEDVEKHRDVLRNLFERAYQEAIGR